MDRQKLMKWILTAMVAAICAVGAAIKVPAFISTAALDSAPAFLGVVFLSPLLAGVAGLIGHFISALTAGFPLGPLHVIIAIEMFIVVWIFGVMHKKGMHVWKWPVALILNGIVAPLPFYFIISPAFFWGALASIFIATAINLMIVAVVMPILSKVFVRKAGRV
ncbi:ECF transporter S component [Lysinibacillus sp. FSL M8-0216]|uniref:Alpha-ribazole transporter (TC 2.A.88.4.2) n=1 Tax=Lysinibacillus fusiformis TaxID=28031 RepID=A0A1H9A409_9BACI|nr:MULTISPECIES: ECF transporter S component [Lysinibacillus]MED4670946.1 ECF transporter S component [Lysinibacillus fusiformis]QAS55567.1 ECF transporter S component [Lysinibacillus sphaericus]RDV30776.1 ECF transporter S component [Lysinibacillus fusiformis]SCX86842.1 alpha-ribazole transporter (TC 2.A.88.4.2) [Lysinibacillus fusiformis]SEM82810.1 alpha-ribazole transporter (TC 2.A.88.4.2) [Lysinibacillus fusiformis]